MTASETLQQFKKWLFNEFKLKEQRLQNRRAAGIDKAYERFLSQLQNRKHKGFVERIGSF